jgi:hypothetical protein
LVCGKVVKEDAQRMMWTNHLVWSLVSFPKVMRRLLICMQKIHARMGQQLWCARTQKKDAHLQWKYTIIRHAMSLRLVEGG